MRSSSSLKEQDVHGHEEIVECTGGESRAYEPSSKEGILWYGFVLHKHCFSLVEGLGVWNPEKKKNVSQGCFMALHVYLGCFTCLFEKEVRQMRCLFPTLQKKPVNVPHVHVNLAVDFAVNFVMEFHDHLNLPRKATADLMAMLGLTPKGAYGNTAF